MSFQNIKLLECNREQSAEKNNNSENNALFTNRLGEVIELNPGDQISLQSAFINKRGTANLNSIEFKGKSLGVTGKFIQTSTAETDPTTYSIDNRYKEVKFYTDYSSNLQTTDDSRPTQSGVQQGNVAFRQIFNEEIVKNLRDNELHLETVFYKTTNGENYAVMPKNYIRSKLDELDGNVGSGKNQTLSFCTLAQYYDSQYFNRPDHDIDTFLYYVENTDTTPPTKIPYNVYMKGIMSGVSRYAPNTYIGMGEQMGIYNYIDSFCSADYRRVQQIVEYGTYESDSSSHQPGEPALTTYYGQSFDSDGGSTFDSSQPSTQLYITVASNSDVTSFMPEDGSSPAEISADFRRSHGNYYEDIRAVQENQNFTLFEREYDWLMWRLVPQENPTSGNTPITVPHYIFIDLFQQRHEVNSEYWFSNTLPISDAEPTDLPEGFPARFLRSRHRSPALFPYLKRSKVNTITLNKGYSTPQSIAEQITEQLQRQDIDSPYIYEKTINTDSSNKDAPNYGNKQQKPAYSTAFQTRFFEPVNCANRHYFSNDNYKNYFSTTDTDFKGEKAFLWWKNFHNMYFKRPDLYEAGTKVNNMYGFVNVETQQANPNERNPGLYESQTNEEIFSSIGNYIWNTIPAHPTLKNNTTDPIITRWLYTTQNLKNLQNLFDAQGKHPELFFDETKDGSWNYPFMNKTISSEGDISYLPNATIENSRFLHINRFNINILDAGDFYNGGNVFNILGDDGFVKLTYGNGESGASERTFDTDHRAVPFFFKYDPENRNKDTGGTNTEELSYGFATKTTRNGYDYITLHPELLNGLRADVFNMRGGQQPFTQSDTSNYSDVAVWDTADISGFDEGNNNYTIVGWDRHFTSWGNQAIMETTGQTPVSYDGLSIPTSIGQGIPYIKPLTEPGGTISKVRVNVAGTGFTPGTHTNVEVKPFTTDPNGITPGDPSTGTGARFTIVIASDGSMASGTIEKGGLHYRVGDSLEVQLPSTGVVPLATLIILSTETNVLVSDTPIIEMAYAGTNNIACVYDQISNKFGFEYLHMPEFVGNEYDAGATDYIDSQDAESGSVAYNIPIDDDAGNEVYKINKRLRKMAFCQDMTPYMDMTATIKTNYQAGNPGQTRIDPMNNAFSPWVVYDTKGGVAINFGKSAKIDESISEISQSEAWNNSVLGILGYSYEQFNPEVITARNTYQGRLTNNNINSVYFPTTNSEILTSDSDTYYMNPFGAVLYTNQLPTAVELSISSSSTYNNTGGITLPWHFLPSIVKPTKSLKIEGVNLPRVTLNPYMTIRSDLITSKKYFGGKNSGLSLPIIGIVQKINADKDYLETAIGEVFTVTEPMKFSSITTAICDPDGSLSLLDQGSAVIYKIAKNDSIENYSFLEDFKKNLNK